MPRRNIVYNYQCICDVLQLPSTTILWARRRTRNDGLVSKAGEDAESGAPRTGDDWAWCTCPADPNQLTLLEQPASAVPLRSWPLVETGWSACLGFWYQRTAAVFGGRCGVGPLVICPDTNVLIMIYENLDVVEDAIGLVAPLPPVDGWPGAVEALRDLLALWWWRDVRFWVDPGVHLADARRPVRADRMRAREIAVRQFSRDFFERGSFDVVLRDEGPVPVSGCPLHPDRGIGPPRSPATPRWPRDELDRRLTKAAFGAGCHVLVTEDRDMLKSHDSLVTAGMSVMRPAELMVALESTGELEPVRSVHEPVPDLSALARFYSLRAPGEE